MSELSDLLLPWFAVNARDLPWRNTKDPYAIWVSEIMLQQTQIDTVRKYFSSFMERFPSLEKLAASKEDDVLKSWEGLGYYSRAKNLYKGAKKIYFDLGGVFPTSKQKWLEIPGVGDYASSSIASICFDEKCVALDGNLFRVFSRLNESKNYFNDASKKLAVAFYKDHLPDKDSGDFNQALMEIGETICLPKGAPCCSSCPLSSICKACGHLSFDQYPLPKPKKEKRRVSIFVFLIESHNTYLVRKRPSTGLLGNLYEFPSFESMEEAKRALTSMGVNLDSKKVLGKNVHEFSHIVWDMTWFYVRLEERLATSPSLFVSVEELHEKITLPNAFTNFLKTKHLCGF